MLTIIICLVVVAVLLGLMLFIDRLGWLGPELRRKFFHMSAGTFAAFWPWLMSFYAIKILGLAMLVAVALNQRLKLINFTKGLSRKTYGVAFSGLGILAAAMFSNSKVVFAMSILCVSIADGLAALVGTQRGQHWRYKVFGQTKTVIGTMTFWISCLFILGLGLPFISAQHYTALLVFLPPFLALAENISPDGLDNLTVPLALILVIRLVA